MQRMNILVVGGGGREHAIIKKLSESPLAGEIYAMPGNGGISKLARCLLIKPTDIDGMVTAATGLGVDFAVVAQDDPLVLGAADRLREAGIPCFGPTAAAARIEGSKLFAKELMKKYRIPTARYEAFTDARSALDHIAGAAFPAVVKADGLALGKGVFIVHDMEEANDAVRAIMVDKRFGKSGDRIVVEEFLTGPEVTVLAFTDGETVVPMVSSMDHKAAYDGGKGPNTGGMGVIAPNPYYTDDIAGQCMQTIFLPTVRAMKAEGCPFSGCLYFGLMLTPDGPKVIEYNCRFGDPEAQAVLPLIETDLLEIMLAVCEGRLADLPVHFKKGASCCVTLASGGYPGKYETGYPISFGRAAMMRNVTVYHAGTRFEDGKYLTAGGRVLGVTATADTLPAAVKTAYEAAESISFTDKFMRHDIGREALEAKRW